MKKTHPLLVGIESVKPYAITRSEHLYTIKPPPMQIEDFLPAGGIMGITSLPGVGKSWLVMKIVKDVTSGAPFLGKFKTVRGGCLFVGSDSSEYDYAQQWSRLTRNTPDARDTYEPARFLLQSSFMLDEQDEIRRLIATHRKFKWGDVHTRDGEPTREGGFHVIIIDTLSRTTRANQNDNTEMEEVFRNVRWLAEATSAAIILLHHNSKKSEFNDGSDWRGAMSQIGALDSWVHLSPARKDKYLIGVQFKKFRGITPDNFAYRMNVLERDSASLEISTEPVTIGQRMVYNPISEHIAEELVKKPGLRATELRDILWPRYEEGIDAAGKAYQFSTKEKFYKAINNRVAAGLAAGKLTRKANEQGKPIYYAVVDPAKEVPAEPVVSTSPKQRRAPTSRSRSSKKSKKR